MDESNLQSFSGDSNPASKGDDGSNSIALSESSFVGRNPEKQTINNKTGEVSTDSQDSDELNKDYIHRVETVADVLSRHTTRSGRAIEDPELQAANSDSFDARAIFASFVRDAEEQGIHVRKAGVTLEDVSAEGINASMSEGRTVGDLLAFPYTIHKYIRSMSNTKMRKILQNCNALAKPGEMILVLGRPGAGCSSFLKVTAGEIDQFAGGVKGDIAYDGIPQDEMMKKYKGDVIYNGELDVHFPFLTVQQTLDFAIACKTPAKRVNNISKAEYVKTTRELYATIFGLRHTYHTKVGNDFVRGVSGGERKRVSIAEALVANGSVYCWDNATRGLDASTALEYAKAIRIMTNLLESTAFVTIYQASENIYETFDKVTVLYDGRQIYYGGIHEATEYFTEMGYERPSRQATAEYLTALTDRNGYHQIRPGFEDKVPRSVEEFERYWLESPEFAQLRADITSYKAEIDSQKTRELYNQSLAEEKAKGTRTKSYYTISYLEQIKLCTKRGFQRIYGNKAYTVINVSSSVIQAFIAGSLFYKSPSDTSGSFSRSGVLYFSLLFYSLMGLANITFEHRPILQKHKNYSLYHPSAEALASTFSAAPFRMISLTCFIIILYFLAGLHVDAGAFFIVYLFLTMCSETINSLFEMITAV